MPDKTLKAQLIADDKMSAVFKKAGDSAKTLGDALEETGTAGKAAAKELDTAGKSADDLNQRLSDAYKGGQQLGIGLLGLAAASTVAGKSYRDQQIGIDNLQRSYGDASDQILDFANNLQDSTNYSNDAAIAAANNAATLARNYGFTADEIQRVLTISADLAATSGLSLEDTTQRVVAALRGEAEGAEVLGLTLNQAAIDSNNLTLSMSNQEAGHYRLNALIQQSAFAQGAAAQQADSSYGAMLRLAHGIQDLGQSYGGSLGVIGEFGALIADHPREALAATAALKSLEIGLKGVVSIYKSTKGINLGDMLGGGASAVPGVSKLVGLLTGPGGLVVAAGAAAVGIGLLGRHFTDDLPKASQASIDSMQELINKIVEAGDKSEYAVTLLQLDDVMTENKKVVDEYRNSLTDLSLIQGQLVDQGSVPIDADIFENLTQHQRELIDANGDLWISYDEVTAAAASWETQANSAAAVNEGLGNSLDELQAVWQMTGEAGQFAQKEAMAYTAALIAGQITPERYEQLLQALIMGYENAGEAALAAGDDVSTLTARMQQGVKVWEEYNKLAYGEGGQHLGQEHREAAEGIEQENAARDSAIARMQDYLDLEQRIAGAAVATGSKIKDLNYDLDNRFTGAKEFGGEFKYDFNFGNALDGMTQAEKTMQDFGDRVIQAFDQIPTAAEAMDSVFQAIVGNTDSIGKSAQSIEDWATGFTDASEGMSRLDSILDTNNTLTSAATINQTEYNAAMEAFNTIGQENAEIQQDIAVIQAKQAPLIAEQVEQTENYLNALADMPAAQQAVALGFMDAAQSGHALELQQLALDAALGNLGANGKEFATQIITGAVEADGQLKLMLEDMGLISEVDGEIVVNFQDNASDGLSRLNDTIEKLAYTQILIAVGIDDPEKANDYFEELFGHAAEWDDTLTTADADLTIDHALAGFETAQNVLAEWDRSVGTGTADADNSGAMGTLGEAMNALGEWDRSTGTATINVLDSASGIVGAVMAQLHNLDGYSATAYLNVVQTGSFGTEFRHGGVPGYAHGGIPVELAEAGGELLHFANGGVLPIMQHGIYSVPPNTYVSPANTGTAYGGPNITVSFDGATFNGTDAEAMDRWAQERLVPALRRVIQDERRGQAS